MLRNRLGTNSSMFTNCSVFCDVRHVRSSLLGQNVMFGKFDVRTFNVRSIRSSVFWWGPQGLIFCSLNSTLSKKLIMLEPFSKILLSQCSKMGKKCNFKSAKKHYFHFQKWQKINFCSRKCLKLHYFFVVLNFFLVVQIN